MRSFGYLLKEGVKGIFSHGFMSFAAVIVTVACLLIVGSFSVLMYNVNNLVEELDQTNEVVVLIDETRDESSARSVETTIRVLDNIREANFKSRDEALEEFKQAHDNDPSLDGIVASDLRHRVEVVLIDNSKMEQTVEAIKKIDGVAEVTASYELAEGFTTVQRILQIVTIVVMALLGLVSLVIISNTVKLAMMDRKEEIGIMKMVGATNGFIRLPFIVQGFLLGMISAGIAFGLEWLLYDALIGRVGKVDSLNLFNFVPFQELLIPMIITFGACGMFVGILGSCASIRKFIDV
jgi:cell division transport system permease protein